MNKKLISISFIICAIIVAFAALFASSHPDGLEWVAGELGFENAAVEKNLIGAPMPDYSAKHPGGGALSTFVAGLSGVVAVFFCALFAAWIVSRRKRRSEGIEKF